uniref:Uncharacterized protein n=1 Tax=viral metagenome TaxID=1070528 RepID=A0A6H1ZZW2_9ZZZZ
MTNEDYKPRFSFEISYEQKLRADTLLVNYGLRRSLFTIILDDVLDLIQDHGGLAVGIIMSKQCKPRDLLPSLKGIEQVANKIGE